MTLVDDRGGEILRRLPRDRSIMGAEVGVFDGRLSQKLLEEAPNLVLLMVDRWVPVAPDHPYYTSGSEIARMDPQSWLAVRQIARERVAPYGGRAVMLQGESHAIAHQIQLNALEFAFIDADHSLEAVLEDLSAWLPRIRAGGWLCGHDWDHPENHIEGDGKRWGVKEAVLRFFSEARVELGENRTWFVQV